MQSRENESSRGHWVAMKKKHQKHKQGRCNGVVLRSVSEGKFVLDSVGDEVYKMRGSYTCNTTHLELFQLSPLAKMRPAEPAGSGCKKKKRRRWRRFAEPAGSGCRRRRGSVTGPKDDRTLAELRVGQQDQHQQ